MSNLHSSNDEEFPRISATGNIFKSLPHSENEGTIRDSGLGFSNLAASKQL